MQPLPPANQNRLGSNGLLFENEHLYCHFDLDDEDRSEIYALREQGKKIYYLDEEEDFDFRQPPPVWVLLAGKQYECNCDHHTIDHLKDDVAATTVPLYSQVVGKTYTAQGDGYVQGDDYGLMTNFYLPQGELRRANSILSSPDFYQFEKQKVDLFATNGALPEQIEEACFNLCVGWNEHDVLVVQDREIVRVKGKPCKCGGYTAKGAYVLDAPCFCRMAKYHNTNVVPLDDYSALIVNSPGFRLNRGDWPVNVEPHRCGFRGRTKVYEVASGSWVVEAVATYGFQGFCFTPKAFEDLLGPLSRFAEARGGIHPNIAVQLANMIIMRPNARVLLNRLVKTTLINAPT